MFSSFVTVFLILCASVVVQSSPAVVVCVAGQCLQGLSNTTIGATISAPGAPTSLLLLPGQYTSTTNPALLHSILTTSSASLAPSPGFGNSSSPSLPLNVALQPGLAVYPGSLFSGVASFAQLPSTSALNASTPLSAGSLAISSSVWVAVNAGSNNRVVLWDSIPDMAQLPSASSGSLSLLDIESSACSPPCASSGICSTAGTCTCAPGFTGASCESCATGFFGPNCSPCPSGCTSCDEGISGTGRCLTTTATNLSSSCNCLNGACQANGQCSCNTGWTTADNGTACAKCSPGFFLTSTGDCKVCAIGCTQCADGSGECTSCKSGFTQDGNDRTKCNATPSVTSAGAVCPDGSFGSGTSCQPCSPSCKTCSGGTSNDCIICGSGSFTLNGSCVTADSNGVCAGTNLIGDNNKHECDSCGAKCTACKIPNFSPFSIVTQLQCTGCLPGFVLSQGQCVESCPTGTFVSPSDNLTCTACDSSCSTCAGSSTFCLTCSNNQLASGGKCVTSCPSNTFSSSGSCLSCHPDCSTCSGSSFNQCSSCSVNRPVLTNGRCLPTCSKSQFFDKTSSTCQSCDSSCSSCSGSGPSNCLACSSNSQVLRSGSCVSVSCTNSSTVVPGLGVCLSDLVTVSQATGTGTVTAVPTITGLTTPIPIVTTTRRPLAWWEILLMALGCAFIFLVFVMCWRRRARKVRAKQTAMFATAKQLNGKNNWRWRLIRFGEKLFGHKRSIPVEESEDIKLMKMRDAEEARHEREMEKLVGAYEYSRAGSRLTRGPSTVASVHDHLHRQRDSQDSVTLSAESLYSQVTGVPRRIPEPRQPLKNVELPKSRFSLSTFASSSYSGKRKPPPPITDAEAYAQAVRSTSPGGTNPFRR